MIDLETNASVTPCIENALDYNITNQNLILEIEELKKAKERNEVKLVILEANTVAYKQLRACTGEYLIILEK